MAKPKKDKYIRDLFEEDFYKKFFEFICSANKDVLVKNYFENRNCPNIDIFRIFLL